MRQSPHKSKAWIFIGVAFLGLVLFMLNTMFIVSKNGIESPTSLNAFLSFLFACTALGGAIGSNVSAYLNPDSSPVTRLISPILFFVIALFIIPSLATLGLSLLNPFFVGMDY